VCHFVRSLMAFVCQEIKGLLTYLRFDRAVSYYFVGRSHSFQASIACCSIVCSGSDSVYMRIHGEQLAKCCISLQVAEYCSL